MHSLIYACLNSIIIIIIIIIIMYRFVAPFMPYIRFRDANYN